MKILYLVVMMLGISGMVMASPVDVKILAWNVYMLPTPLKFSMQDERIPLIAQELAKLDHDVILLEEAFLKNFRNTVQKTLAKTHPYAVELPRDGYVTHVMPSGLFALSKYPMRLIGRDYYHTCTKADCFAAKGVMLLEVDVPQKRKLHISLTHLNCGQSEKAVFVRSTQLAQIAGVIHDYESADIPLIVAGDLNIDANKGNEFNRMLGTLNVKSLPLENPRVPSSDYPTCYKKFKSPTGKWVDHILLNPRATHTLILNKRIREFSGTLQGSDCALSDHQAIEAVVRIYE